MKTEKKNHKHKNNKIHILKMQVNDLCMCVVKESEEINEQEERERFVFVCCEEMKEIKEREGM
jgi:hypothetical protein